VVTFTPLPLYLHRKSPQYPFSRRVYVPQNWFGHCEKNLLPLQRIKSQFPAIQAIAHCYTDLAIPARIFLLLKTGNRSK
jgi:hypothetical protein